MFAPPTSSVFSGSTIRFQIRIVMCLRRGADGEPNRSRGDANEQARCSPVWANLEVRSGHRNACLQGGSEREERVGCKKLEAVGLLLTVQGRRPLLPGKRSLLIVEPVTAMDTARVRKRSKARSVTQIDYAMLLKIYC
jgi:hypothetical protein